MSSPHNQKGCEVLCKTWAKIVGEEIAAALGLDSAYGVPNPDEPGDYLSEKVDISKIDWDAVEAVDGAEVFPKFFNKEWVKQKSEEGWSMFWSPSY